MNAELESLLDEARVNPGQPAPEVQGRLGGSTQVRSPALWPSGARQAIQKVSYTHDAMIDLMIATPGISQNELAARFGYSPSWISQVISSDAFQARLAERSSEIIDPALKATVEDRFKGVMMRSLDILQQKLDRPAGDIPDNLALRTFEIASRAAGYGLRKDPPVAVQVNVNQHLESLGENLIGLLRRQKAEVSGETIDIGESEDG